MFDAFELEKQGKPTITVCHSTFEKPARLHAKSIGMPDLPLLIEPVPRGASVNRDMAAVNAMADTMIDEVIRCLTGALASSQPGSV